MANKNIPKSYSYSAKTNSSLWIRIDLSKITFYPSQKTMSSSLCSQMELLLKYTRQVLAISFNKGTGKKKSIDEIQVPWDRIASFRVFENNDIEVVFCEGFKPNVSVYMFIYNRKVYYYDIVCYSMLYYSIIL